jgi:hypothetical protein
MALLKRELYRQMKGPEVTQADRCTLVFDTDAKNLYTARLRSKPPHWILRITSNKAAKLLDSASYGGC